MKKDSLDLEYFKPFYKKKKMQAAHTQLIL